MHVYRDEPIAQSLIDKGAVAQRILRALADAAYMIMNPMHGASSLASERAAAVVSALASRANRRSEASTWAAAVARLAARHPRRCLQLPPQRTLTLPRSVSSPACHFLCHTSGREHHR